MEIVRRQQATFHSDLTTRPSWKVPTYLNFKPNYAVIKQVVYNPGVQSTRVHAIQSSAIQEKNNILFVFPDGDFSCAPDTTVKLNPNSLSDLSFTAVSLENGVVAFAGDGTIAFTIDFILSVEKTYYFDRFDILFNKLDKLIHVSSKAHAQPIIIKEEIEVPALIEGGMDELDDIKMTFEPESKKGKEMAKEKKALEAYNLKLSKMNGQQLNGEYSLIQNKHRGMIPTKENKDKRDMLEIKLKMVVSHIKRII